MKKNKIDKILIEEKRKFLREQEEQEEKGWWDQTTDFVGREIFNPYADWAASGSPAEISALRGRYGGTSGAAKYKLKTNAEIQNIIRNMQARPTPGEDPLRYVSTSEEGKPRLFRYDPDVISNLSPTHRHDVLHSPGREINTLFLMGAIHDMGLEEMEDLAEEARKEAGRNEEKYDSIIMNKLRNRVVQKIIEDDLNIQIVGPTQTDRDTVLDGLREDPRQKEEIERAEKRAKNLVDELTSTRYFESGVTMPIAKEGEGPASIEGTGPYDLLAPEWLGGSGGWFETAYDDPVTELEYTPATHIPKDLESLKTADYEDLYQGPGAEKYYQDLIKGLEAGKSFEETERDLEIEAKKRKRAMESTTVPSYGSERGPLLKDIESESEDEWPIIPGLEDLYENKTKQKINDIIQDETYKFLMERDTSFMSDHKPTVTITPKQEEREEDIEAEEKARRDARERRDTDAYGNVLTGETKLINPSSTAPSLIPDWFAELVTGREPHSRSWHEGWAQTREGGVHHAGTPIWSRENEARPEDLGLTSVVQRLSGGGDIKSGEENLLQQPWKAASEGEHRPYIGEPGVESHWLGAEDVVAFPLLAVKVASVPLIWSASKIGQHLVRELGEETLEKISREALEHAGVSTKVLNNMDNLPQGQVDELMKALPSDTTRHFEELASNALGPRIGGKKISVESGETAVPSSKFSPEAEAAWFEGGPQALAQVMAKEQKIVDDAAEYALKLGGAKAKKEFVEEGVEALTREEALDLMHAIYGRTIKAGEKDLLDYLPLGPLRKLITREFWTKPRGTQSAILKKMEKILSGKHRGKSASHWPSEPSGIKIDPDIFEEWTRHNLDRIILEEIQFLKEAIPAVATENPQLNIPAMIDEVIKGGVGAYNDAIEVGNIEGAAEVVNGTLQQVVELMMQEETPPQPEKAVKEASKIFWDEQQKTPEAQ